MKLQINAYQGPQLGLMLSTGKDFEGNRMFTIDLPFLSFQFIFIKLG